VSSAHDAPYTLKRVEALIGLQPAVVRLLVARGFVTPSRGPRREPRFTFRDLLLLKVAAALRRASVPTARILESLTRLEAELPPQAPLTGLRITAAGNSVAVRDASGVREAMTGQLLLDFEVQLDVDALIRIEDASPSEVDWFVRGQALDGGDPPGAEAAYRKALEADPAHLDARVNLGALLCEAGRCRDAVRLYDEALDAGVASPSLHFNRAIALEDLGDGAAASDAYRQAIHLDPSFADAHYNLGLLLEKAGDAKGALRHFSAYRRLSSA